MRSGRLVLAPADYHYAIVTDAFSQSGLQRLRELLDRTGPDVPLAIALRDALLAFNTFDECETIRHRRRMQVILQTAELQAYSMTMYAGWRAVIADNITPEAMP